MLQLILILNIIWFTLGFHTFYIRRGVFAKLVVPREHRGSPVFATLVESGRFLGGFNFAFAVMNTLLLLNVGLFDNEMQWAILLAVNAVAHGSQFAGNIPIALQNRRGEGVWRVFSGLMLFIFVTDCVLMLGNALLAATYMI